MAENKKQTKKTQKLNHPSAKGKNVVIEIKKETNLAPSRRTQQNKEVQEKMSKYTIGMLKDNRRGYGIINNGEDNLFPDYLNGLATKSPTNKNIVKDLTDYIYGKGLKAKNPKMQAKLDKILNTRKVKNIISSKLKQAAIFLELIRGEVVDEVVRVDFINASQMRVNQVENGTPVSFVYRKSWDKSDSNNFQVKELYDYWDFDNMAQESGIFYWYDSGDFPVYYGRPLYIAGLDAIELEISSYKGVNHGVQNGNEPSKIIELTSSGNPEQDKKDIEAITRDTSGVANRGKLAIRMKPQGAESMTVIETNQSELAEQYQAIFELAEIGILKSWGVPSPSLISGLNQKSAGLAGSLEEEMKYALQVLNDKIIEPERAELIEILDPIVKVCGIDGGIFFEDRDTQIESIVEEAKKEQGVESTKMKLDNNISQTIPSITRPTKEKEQEFLKDVDDCILGAETFEEIAGDGFIPILATPVSENNEAGLMEEIEKQIKATKLAKSGFAYGNAQSVNDGELKDIQYKIRYRYERADGYPNKSGSRRGAQRDFCALMMDGSQPRNRWFRIEDIDRMSQSAVNSGFGIGGDANYDILAYKGGPNCKHIWVQYVFVKQGLEGSIDVKSPIAQSEKLDMGKAASIGIRPKEGDDPLMGIPPYAMLNHGYYNAKTSSHLSATQQIKLSAVNFYEKMKGIAQRAAERLNSVNSKPSNHG